MERNNFVLSYDYNDIFKDLSEKQAGVLVKAIYEYQIEGTIANFSDLELRMAFKFIKKNMDFNNKQYEEKCMKNKENVRKRWDKERDENTKDTTVYLGKMKNTTAYLGNTKNTKDTDNDVDNDNENEDVKGKEDSKGKNQNDQTDISFLERHVTTNSTANDTENGVITGTSTSQEAKAQGARIQEARIQEAELQATESLSDLASSEVISDVSVNTFRERVEYAKSLGIEESVAKRICNLAQSRKIGLCEMHYKWFVGKDKKEIEGAFYLLDLLAQNQKKFNGLRRINSS
jgi:hypothetical protein